MYAWIFALWCLQIFYGCYVSNQLLWMWLSWSLHISYALFFFLFRCSGPFYPWKFIIGMSIHLYNFDFSLFFIIPLCFFAEIPLQFFLSSCFWCGGPFYPWKLCVCLLCFFAFCIFLFDGVVSWFLLLVPSVIASCPKRRLCNFLTKIISFYFIMLLLVCLFLVFAWCCLVG